MLAFFFNIFGGQIGGAVCGFFSARPSALAVSLSLGMVSAGEWIAVGLGVVQTAFNFFVGFHLRRKKTTEDRIAVLEKTKISLQAELVESSNRMIDQRFSHYTDALRLEMKSLSSELQRVNLRLDKGDEEFRDLLDRGHEIKVGEALKDSEMQRWIMQTFATKQDVSLMSDRVAALTDAVMQRIVHNNRAVRP